MKPKKLSVLGSTGSIGKNCLKVVRNFPQDFAIEALAANKQIDVLYEQILEFSPKIVAVFDLDAAKQLQERLPSLKIKVGLEGVIEAATAPNSDTVVSAMTGAIGIAPTAAAIQAKKNICLANKEVLVSGGHFITSLAKQQGVALIPIDSELTAIFQCLQGRKLAEVARIVLTASGGPFLHRSQPSLANISVEEAMQHPNWKMGPKVTIDSSTMINKGFEAIEAHFLFDLPFDKIDIVVHPQSIIHGMVEFIDGSILAQLSDHDMLFPIQYALTHPQRSQIALPRFDFTKHGLLQFFAPDLQKFPCLHLAKAALQTGGSAPCYLNGANEILVHRFLQRDIPWTGIAEKLATLLNRHISQPVNDLQSILEIDKQARKEALQA